MAYVEENKKFKTSFGKIKNNNRMKQIQRNNTALFNFSISEVTVDDGVLTVVCDTITGDTVEYTLDLDSDAAELSAELYNYTVGGSIEIFLAIVWKLYLSTLDDEGEQVDTESYESLHDTILSLTAENETLTGQVESLTTSNETLTGQVNTLTARVAELEAELAALTPESNNEEEQTNNNGGE